jgi:hypothetical protein
MTSHITTKIDLSECALRDEEPSGIARRPDGRSRAAYVNPRASRVDRSSIVGLAPRAVANLVKHILLHRALNLPRFGGRVDLLAS